MAHFAPEFTSNSSSVLMSLLSEPISCSWMPPEKEDTLNLPKLIPLVDKPPSGKKIEEKDNFSDHPELNLDLYTIPESISEENTTDGSESEYFTNKKLNENELIKHQEINSTSDLCIEDIDSELTNINNVEKQTDLILKDLQLEQNQLTEIVNDIDKLFEKDETNNNTTNITTNKKLTFNSKRTNSFEIKNKNIKEIIPENDYNVSTYSDIVNILEELEKENQIENNTPKNKTVTKKEEITNKNLPSCKDYSDLLSYLDEIDENCANTLNAAKQRVQNITDLVSTNIRLEAVPKLDDLLKHTNIELANYVIDLTLRLEDKVSSISMLKTEISKLHKLIENNEEDREKLIKQKVTAEKNKYEPVIKRHQTFIDQLIIDKKELNEKCERLMSDLKTLEGRHTHNMHAAEQRHKIEIRRCKEMHEAAEKVKREKWMEAKTAKIKELTIKSVEHEINTMQEKYQKEISEIKLSHKQEIEDLELKFARKTQQQCETLREQLTKEREHAIANEREALKQRFEKLVESEEKGYQEQKRRLREEHNSRVNELKVRELELEKERDNAIDVVKQDCEERLKVAQRRHDIQIANMKESLRLELEMWKNNYLKEQNIKMTDTESRIRETFKKERDREIELVIDKLERESEKSRIENEIAAENRLRRLKEKYDDELRHYQRSEEGNKKKEELMKSEIQTQENTIVKLKKSLKQLEEDHKHMRKLSDNLQAEKHNIREVIRQEFISEIITLKNELKTEQHKKEKELQDIYNRVKISIARKDEQINKINEDNKQLHDKCRMLENVIEQQRRDYLMR